MIKWLTKIPLYIVSLILFIYSGIMVIFASAGICCVIWGDEILHTALGTPPDYGHPAFYLFILLMVPSMLIGFAGGFFLVILPIYSIFNLKVLDSSKNMETTRKICNWFVKHLQRLVNNLV